MAGKGAQMNSIQSDFVAWILEQHIDDCTLFLDDNNTVVLDCAAAHGTVSFYDLDDVIVAELRLEKDGNDAPLFFLHFELNDLERAKQLFGEMSSALDHMLHRTIRHVLLCCTCGMTTAFFANKLNEDAQKMDIGYDFCAMSVDEAKQSGNEYAAILLAPQVGYERKAISAALPETLVLEIPARVFGTYDTTVTLRLLLNAFAEAQDAAATDLRVARDYDHSKRVLGVCYAYRSDDPTISYLVLDKGTHAVSGMIVRPVLDTWIIDDMVATLRVAGYPIESFDAIGIAFPGVVNEGVVTWRTQNRESKLDLASIISERVGVPVYIDNGATAAAAACYAGQTQWDNVAFHAQPIGVPACDQGYVVNGQPMTGHRGFSGDLKYLAKDFTLSMDLDDAAWRYDGSLELVSRYLCATACTIAPQAIYVWCDLVPDMDDVRDEMTKTLPDEAIPELIAVSDYDSHMLMGELALCLQRLAEAESRT